MMRKLLLISMASIFTMPTAFAQDIGDNDPIVVTGDRLVDKPAAEKFVGEITTTTEMQLARFHKPVCPVVAGLSRQYSAAVEERIRENARAAGLKVEKKLPCVANVTLVIAENGGEFVTDIRVNRTEWLAGLSPAEIRRVIETPGPARAWMVTSLRNEDGMRLTTNAEGTDGNPLNGKPSLRVMSASILRKPTRWDVEGAFVVLDRAAIIGLSLTQIADYVSMRGLAGAQPPKSGSVDSILTLFDRQPESRPVELTVSDSRYLVQLYKGKGTDSGVTERARIAKAVAAEG